MPAKVRKAVFPAAGLGTRFLPATKAQPKEMLPIVDKPIIQYGVEEALHSGIQNIIIVTGRGKTAIEDHFDVSFELEYLLESRSKKDLLAIVHGISDMINVSYVRQREALGLGHAVLRAMELVGDEPFAVVLADDVIEAETPCLRQLLDIYQFFCAPVLAVMEVPPENISAYGAIDAESVAHNGSNDRVYRIRNLVDRMEVFGDERPLAKEPVNIHDVLEHVRRVSETGFARGIRFTEDYDPSLPPIPGNRDKLVQVFLNLAKNAAEAIGEDKQQGRIIMQTSFRPGVRLSMQGSDRRVSLPLMIQIEDNGPGVPDHLKEHLFDPFVTTKPYGTGLGLALVAKIINDHGGIIECDSEPSRTIFRVLLPMQDRMPAPNQRSSPR